MFLTNVPHLAKTFSEYFEIVPVLSDELRDEVYRIRHAIYCEELGFEPMRCDGRECDEHDARSLHLLMRSMKTGQFIGCARIIRARWNNKSYELPFEKACAATLDRSLADPLSLPRDSIAELSRLAVIAQFRRRKSDPKTPLAISENDFGTPAQPRFPYIPVGLYLGTVALARLNAIETIFFLTEPHLANHFRRFGVNIETVGGPVEHRGQRIPSMMKTRNVLDNLWESFRPLYDTIAEQIGRGGKAAT